MAARTPDLKVALAVPINCGVAQTVHSRPSVSTAVEPSHRGWHWRYAAIVSALTVGACLFTTFLLPPLLGFNQWMTLGDAKWTIQSAQYVANGGLGYVYSVNIQFLPLPGFLLVLAPFVAIGDHFGLINGYPYAIPHPSMLLVAAPVFFVCGASCILGADYLASTLGVSPTRRRILAPAIGALVVLPTCCWAGHPEDLLALTLACVSLAFAIRGRHATAAVTLAVGIMMQPWALLLIPLLAVIAPAGFRVRSVVYSSALPAITGLTLLAIDFKDAARSLILQPMQGNGQHLPWWSLTHQMIAYQDRIPVPVRVGSGPRLLAVVTAVAAAWLIRNDVRPATIMRVAAVALAARGIFETQVWCYYLAPAAVFMALGSAMAPRTRRWAFGALAGFCFYGYAAGGYDTYSMSPLLALGLMLVFTVCAVVAAHHGPDEAAPVPAGLQLQQVI